MNKKKNILALSAQEAKDYFLEEDSYFNFDLPPYFKFTPLLKKIDKKFKNKKIKEFYNSDKNIRPKLFDDVNYKIIHNKDGKYAWRPLQLIHPVLYVALVRLITEESNWSEIKNRFSHLKDNSEHIDCEGLPVIPAKKKAKAEQIIHWLDSVEKKSLDYSWNYDYLLHTDITDCYGSIYTHSIAWALHGKEFAKKNRNVETLLGNEIDFLLQAMSHGQTNGIPQGSTLMDFLAELLLCYIDKKLTKKIREGEITKNAVYKIIRYRDDYRIFTNNPRVSEQMVKELAVILSPFGMRINPSKTTSSSDIIHSSIKPDKLNRLINVNPNRSLRSELYYILEFSKSFPNSSQISSALNEFHNRLMRLNKEGHKDKEGRDAKDLRDVENVEEIKILIIISTEIAHNNPTTYAVAAAVISKLIDLLEKEDGDKVIKKIIDKFIKLPNSGIMQIWLQRMTINSHKKNEYTENICKKVSGENTSIWNSDWLNEKAKKNVESQNFIDSSVIDDLSRVIENKEFKLFDYTNSNI